MIVGLGFPERWRCQHLRLPDMWAGRGVSPISALTRSEHLIHQYWCVEDYQCCIYNHLLATPRTLCRPARDLQAAGHRAQLSTSEPTWALRKRGLFCASLDSCYNDEEKVALVEYRRGMPAFLSALIANPLEEWQHFFSFT